MRIMTYKDAVLEVLAEEMKRDPAVFVMAEDLHGRGGGQGKVHMVIRCPDGIVKMQGAHHTDCLEAWFAHVPGPAADSHPQRQPRHVPGAQDPVQNRGRGA